MNTVTRTYYSKNEKAPELIVCSAIKFICIDHINEKYNQELVIPMIRHYSPDGREVMNAVKEWGDKLKELEQGFITNYGNFVNRKEALAIAKANNQIIRDIGYKPDELYSEMLY